jgi:hypothetical protein
MRHCPTISGTAQTLWGTVGNVTRYFLLRTVKFQVLWELDSPWGGGREINLCLLCSVQTDGPI